ncbi:hypothetical protein ABZW32_39120 [Streptomyces sp. NPDC004667]|uniref:COG1470 family protein n=1 Tax=Streptomyces sp. NPDC004667 TaxID=3154285 RepID=UPI0033B11833
MGVIATLSDEVTEVEPGGSASCTVKLLNDGAVVDTFFLDVLGDAKEWSKLTSPEVSVFPGEVATVDIVFAPPREASVRQGRIGFALRVMSQEDTDHSSIVEGTVSVGGYQQVETELISRTLRGSRSARGRIALDNLGNAPVTLRLTGTDDDGKLRFRFPDPSVTVQGGTTRIVSYRLKPRSRFLRGEARTHLYRIQAKGNGSTSEAAGSLVQPAMLAPWAPKALMLAAGAAAVALVVVPTYLVPKTTSLLEGKNVADSQDKKADPADPDPPADAGDKGGDAASKKSGDDAGGTAGSGGSGQGGAANGGQGGSGGSGGSGAGSAGGGSGSGTGGGGSDTKKPELPAAVLADVTGTSFRLEANSKPGKAGTYTLKEHAPVASGKNLAISDLHIENLADDKGKVQLRRDGELLREFDLKDAKKEWHWVEPILFTEGQKVVIAVNCANTNGANCTPAFSFSGRTYTLAR